MMTEKEQNAELRRLYNLRARAEAKAAKLEAKCKKKTAEAKVAYNAWREAQNEVTSIIEELQNF